MKGRRGSLYGKKLYLIDFILSNFRMYCCTVLREVAQPPAVSAFRIHHRLPVAFMLEGTRRAIVCEYYTPRLPELVYSTVVQEREDHQERTPRSTA